MINLLETQPTKAPRKTEALPVRMARSAIARAKKKGFPHDDLATLSAEIDRQLEETQNRCPVFGFTYVIGKRGGDNKSASLDKIDPAKGYVVSNVMVVSFKANRIKSNATPDELLTALSFFTQQARKTFN